METWGGPAEAFVFFLGEWAGEESGGIFIISFFKGFVGEGDVEQLDVHGQAEVGGELVAERELVFQACGLPGDGAIAAEQEDVGYFVGGDDAELSDRAVADGVGHGGNLELPVVFFDQRFDAVGVFGEECDDHVDLVVDVFAGAFPGVIDGALLGTFFAFGGFSDQADWDVALGGWLDEQDECLLALGVLGQGE